MNEKFEKEQNQKWVQRLIDSNIPELVKIGKEILRRGGVEVNGDLVLKLQTLVEGKIVHEESICLKCDTDLPQQPPNWNITFDYEELTKNLFQAQKTAHEKIDANEAYRKGTL